MKINVLDSTKKKGFLGELSYLGDFKLNYLFMSTGTEAIRTYSGHLSTDEILKIWRHFPIEAVGLYFGKETINKHGKRECRVSLDALHILKDQITKNIVELNDEQVLKWFKGDNIDLTPEQKDKYKEMKDFVAVKFKQDFVGTAKINAQGILIGFLPKERRVRN